MIFSVFLTLFHIIGVALGVGGATVSDLLFFRAIKDRRISTDEFALLHTLGYVLWVGLGILFLSGIGFVLSQLWLTGSSTYLVASWFWAKMTIVFILFCNALVMHGRVFPFMAAHLDKKLDYRAVKNKVILLAVTGVISITSWYSALTLGVTRGFDLPYSYIINLYVFLVVIGVLVAYVLFLVAVFPKPLASQATGTPQRRPRTLRIVVVTIIIGAAIVVSAWYAAQYTAEQNDNRATGTTHVVCIIESPPWFVDEVLEIAVGDTVVWTHCHEPGDASAAHDHVHTVPSVFVRTAHAHADHVSAGVVHTHPILSISGPELFSSQFRPIGHQEEGDGFSHTFTEAGVYEYICPTHPYMKGIIAVGETAPVSQLWPPEEHIDETIGLPPEPGQGEVWINTQFANMPAQDYPGSITVVNTETWEVDTVIGDAGFNNPHNLWRAANGRLMYQTQWHSDGLSLIDVASKTVEQTVSLGNAPAHVFTHPHNDLVYVTLNNESRVAVLDAEGNHLRDIITPFGPHGIWISPDGQWMSVASTLAEELAIIDVVQETIVASFAAEGLPLATAITHDSRYAMVSLLLEGVVRFIDLETMQVAADVPVGDMPIWPSPGPNGRYVFVPNSGSNDISVIDLDTLTVVNTIPVAAGAHGIHFGAKAGGGYYGYVSHKYARVMGVLDVEEQSLVGYVPLGEQGWGGNGIFSIDNTYDDFIGAP